MTDYIFDNGNIMKGDVKVGWFAPGLNNAFECLVAIKKILESHSHTVDVQLFIKDFEVVMAEPYIREVKTGYYLTELNDDLYYAYFSMEMNCAKSCAKAVLVVISA